MANTVTQLKTAVAAFLHRDPQAFIYGSASEPRYLTDEDGVILTDQNNNPIITDSPPNLQDLLIVAANNARLYAERRIDFELSVAAVTFPAATLSAGVDMSTAVLTGTSTPANVKKILTPFLPLADSKQYPVDLTFKRKWNDRLKKRFEGARPTDTSDFVSPTDAPFQVVQFGNTLMIVPPDATAFGNGTFNIYADAYLWLPSYVDGTETDFILNNCFDWMMYRCIYELNFFLKEDERVTLSDKLLEMSWDALVIWNRQLIMDATDDSNLD